MDGDTTRFRRERSFKLESSAVSKYRLGQSGLDYAPLTTAIALEPGLVGWCRGTSPGADADTLKQRRLDAEAPATMPGLEEGHRKNVEKYLNEFFDLIRRPEKVKRTFVTECKFMAGM